MLTPAAAACSQLRRRRTHVAMQLLVLIAALLAPPATGAAAADAPPSTAAAGAAAAPKTATSARRAALPLRAPPYRLLFYPLGERTHMLVHAALADELVKRGHEVFLLAPACHVPFVKAALQARRAAAATAAGANASSESTTKSVQFVEYELDCEWVERDKRRASAAGPLIGALKILEALARRADAVLGDQALMARLRALSDDGSSDDNSSTSSRNDNSSSSKSKSKGIDLVIADPLAFGALLPAALGLPFIDFDVGTAGSLYEPVFYGAPAAPAYIPAVGTFLPTHGRMTLPQRALNVIASAVSRAVLHAVYFHPRLWAQRVARKHGLRLARPYTAPLLELVNSNFAVEPPRPVAPVTRYVGPILPGPARPLPADLDAFVTGGGDGSGGGGSGGNALPVVVISFGGTLAPTRAACRAVLRAVALLRGEVRFVWKLSRAERAMLRSGDSDDNSTGSNGNDPLAAPAFDHVFAAEWLPQNDLLGHPSVAAFVTQGGYLSAAEAAYHGVPVVGVPLIAGQGELLRFAADEGRGVLLSKRALAGAHGAEELAAAVRAAATDARFAEAAARVAARLQARAPYAPRAAEWVEYAAALRGHDGAEFLHTRGRALRWWQLAGLDVALLVICLIALPAAWLFFKIKQSAAAAVALSGGGSNAAASMRQLRARPRALAAASKKAE